MRIIIRIFKKLFVSMFLTAVVIFLAACLSPFLNPADWWFFGFLGLLFPYLLVLMVVYLVYWAFKRSKWTFLVIVSMLLGWKSISAAFATHLFSSFTMEKKEGDLRIMTWNVRNFIGVKDKVKRSGVSEHHQKMLDLIKNYNPDVITMQEFVTADSGNFANNIRIFDKELGFRYHYFSESYAPRKHEYVGVAIFSKYPILDTSTIRFDNTMALEKVIYTDIKVNEDTVRFFTAHMRSFGFMGKDYDDIHKIRTDPEERMDASKSIVRKMRVAFQQRGEQADQLNRELEDSRFPEVFSGDLNDVPNSYTYFTIRGDKKDAFIEKGFGFGKTYYSLFSGFMNKIPALRIDYILTDPRIKVTQMRRVEQVLSDHIPLVADISLQNIPEP